ncbi:MAG: class II fructose-bisphosphate aldolase [Treponema sp.]|jgi:ketose-bisphosphate aldolase|nr:class II fructose-bisphosphate aldolase [Treponema sp.]
MDLSYMKPLLEQAAAEGKALGSFTVWALDVCQAVVEAANLCKRPAILMAGKIEARYAGGVKNIVRLAKLAAENSDMPIALHLDHAEEYGFIREAVDSGFTSVMIDASAKSFSENVERTGAVVEYAHRAGVTVEAELGRIGGVEGNIDVRDEDAFQTDPDEARQFVEKTGIDALAVGIGSVHGVYPFPPNLNIPRLKNIRNATAIPLVLHGGTGIPVEQIRASIKNGISKINVCTELLITYGQSMTKTQSAGGFRYSVPNLFAPSKQALKELFCMRIGQFGRE